MAPHTEARARLAAYVIAHSELTLKQIAAKAGISVQTINRICREHHALRRPRIDDNTIAKLEGN